MGHRRLWAAPAPATSPAARRAASSGPATDEPTIGRSRPDRQRPRVSWTAHRRRSVAHGRDGEPVDSVKHDPAQLDPQRHPEHDGAVSQ